jgi:hypothetical protein
MGVLRSINELLETGKKLSSWITGEKFESLRIECKEHEHLGVYTATVHVGNLISKQYKKRFGLIRKFDPQEVCDVKVYGLKPISRRVYEAVVRKQNEIILNLDEVIKLNLETFRLEVVYKMDDASLKGIVRSRSSPEPLENKKLYHLSAQLKDPNSLIAGFSECEIEEYPVTVTVCMQEDINTNIPHYIKKMSEIEAEILRDYDPRHAVRIMHLQKKRAGYKKRLGKEGLRPKLNELSLFLRPSRFRDNYVGIEQRKDFILDQCRWGADIFRALGLMMLPKTMEILTKTNLSLDKKAASGIMIYESGKFSEDIRKLFS